MIHKKLYTIRITRPLSYDETEKIIRTVEFGKENLKIFSLMYVFGIQHVDINSQQEPALMYDLINDIFGKNAASLFIPGHPSFKFKSLLFQNKIVLYENDVWRNGWSLRIIEVCHDHMRKVCNLGNI